MASIGRCFLPIFQEGFEVAVPVGDKYTDRLWYLDGTPRAGDWEPVAMELAREDELGRSLAHADFPFFGGGAVLVLERRAVEVLRPVVGGDAEFLPIDAVESQLLLLHPTRLVDALDEEYSEIIRFSTGNIMTIERYELRAEAIGDAAVFKLPQDQRGPMIVTDRFVEAVESAGLTGLGFQEIWPRS